jgi:peptidoglycan hydrolase-like protein with peptidoglycan-binding domain
LRGKKAVVAVAKKKVAPKKVTPARAAKAVPVKKAVQKNVRLAQVQRLLAKKGAYSGKSTGVMDGATRKSVSGYYKKHKLDRGTGTTLDAVRNHLRGKKIAVAVVKKTAPKKVVPVN